MYIATPTSRKNIRELTNVIRGVLGLRDESYFPIVEFLEWGIHQIDPEFSFQIVGPEELSKQYGMTYPEKNMISLREEVYEGAISGVARDRFTIAHEVGHYFLHKPGNIALARAKHEEKIPAYKDPEWQANTFAGELLAPPHVINGLSAREITMLCGVSMDVARIQLKNI